MSEFKAARDHSRCPSHPGEVIEDILADFHIFKSDIAERIGISRQHLHQIIACRRPLSPEVAVRVAALLGGSAESWLRMQAAYDAWHASRSVDVSRIKRLENA